MTCRRWNTKDKDKKETTDLKVVNIMVVVGPKSDYDYSKKGVPVRKEKDGGQNPEKYQHLKNKRGNAAYKV